MSSSSLGQPVVLEQATVGTQVGQFILGNDKRFFLAEYQSDVPRAIVLSVAIVPKSFSNEATPSLAFRSFIWTLMYTGPGLVGGCVGPFLDLAGAATTISEPRAGILLSYGASSSQAMTAWFDLKAGSYQLPPCMFARAQVFAGSNANGVNGWSSATTNCVVTGGFTEDVDTGLAHPVVSDCRGISAGATVTLQGQLPRQAVSLDISAWLRDDQGNARTPNLRTREEPPIIRDWTTNLFYPQGEAWLSPLNRGRTPFPADLFSRTFLLDNVGGTLENALAYARLAL